MRCPCRKVTDTTPYAVCCEPFHLGTAVAPTAEALMRSRYTAYALGNAAYLRATWHASTRPGSIEFDPRQQWTMLKVMAASTDGDRATITFKARSRIGGSTHVLEETSRFVREDCRWYYVDGDVAT